MVNFLLLATSWGAKYGGINAFNMDFAAGLAEHLGESGKVYCSVFKPSREEVEDAAKKQVHLLNIDRPGDSPAYDKSWASDVWQIFTKQYPNTQIDWWVGHDVTTGCAAIEGPIVAAYGAAALIMHMNYADYQSYKSGVGQRAHEKEMEQRRLFSKADRCFANGPLLRDALRDIVSTDVYMLIPGFADVPKRPTSHRLSLITFGRMDRESDRIKQGALAVAGFASAVAQAWSIKGSPSKLKDNPQMRVIGIKEPDNDEEHALLRLAAEKASREVNLIPLTFDENRRELLEELGRANIALMLSWHEGFGLTGWEALAGEVPLIVSRQSGLWQLLKETFGERFVDGYVRTVDIRGQRGDDDTTNFLPEDEKEVRDAIVEYVADIGAARHSATKLKENLKEHWVCTWTHTARQFCDGLGVQIPATLTKAKDDGQTVSEQRSETAPHSDFIKIPHLIWPVELAAKGIPMPDSVLLRPEAGVVPFHRFREPLRDAIIGWAIDPDEQVKLRLQAGEGGTGKTRLMIEVCSRLQRLHGWRAGFVASPYLGSLVELLTHGKQILLVLDYAECRASEIIDVTRTVLETAKSPLVRLVLLAREGGDWWDHLGDSNHEDVVTATLQRPNAKTGPYRMAKERVDTDDRVAVFTEAIIAFAKYKDAPAPLFSTPDLSGDRFGNPLFIHLAALATLRGQPNIDEKALLLMVLERERFYWRQLLNSERIPDGALPAIQQAIALLTLVSGKRTEREAKALLLRAPKFRNLDDELRMRLFGVLRRLYPMGTGIGGLQPDLLGETLVSEELNQDV